MFGIQVGYVAGLMKPPEKITVHLFDPHSWFRERSICFEHLGDEYELVILQLGEKPIDIQFVLICDEYTHTPLPFFFPRNRRVALLKESPRVIGKISDRLLKKRFDVVLTHQQELISLGKPFYRLDCSVNWVSEHLDGCMVRKTKLVSFVGSVEHDLTGGYAVRAAVARLALKSDQVDCFGRGIREIEHKIDGLLSYCFSIAMENCQKNYYYSEKIIDCFFTETVPIYWGCPAITDIFDSRGMIVFDSPDELFKILEELSFEKYQEMLPYVRINREICVKKGLDSIEHYFVRCIENLYTRLPSHVVPLKQWQMSKPMAMLRLLREKTLL